jgi:hypothetical protein
VAVTPGFLGIDEPATIDKRADTNTMTRAATTVHREVVSIGSADDATPESIAKVDATGSLRTVPTDAAGTNQQAITAAGDAKVTLDGEEVEVTLNGEVVTVDGSSVIQPISAASLPLPTNAAREHATAVSPHSVRLSDGAAFYVGAKTGQLPGSLGLGGALKVEGVNVNDAPLSAAALPVAGVASAAAPADVDTDGDGVNAWHLRNGAAAAVLTAAGALIGGDAANGLDVDVTRLPALPSGTNNIGDVDVLTVPAPLSTTGGGTEATALRVTIANDSTGVVSVDDNGGSLTIDTPQLPAALVGGRLDENVGAWLGSTAPTVGQKTMANSVPVVLASDQAAIPVTPAANSSVNVAQVAGTATAVNKGVASAGTQRVIVAEELQYRAATAATVVVAASAASFFVIAGSASKTIRVRNVVVTGATLTTLAAGSIEAKKWSTALTVGTATALTKVPMDSADAAATANLCQVYTAAPTDGTLVGRVGCRRVILKSSTIVDGMEACNLVFDFGPRGIVLRGTAETLTLAFGAAPASAVTLAVEVEWSEE